MGRVRSELPILPETAPALFSILFGLSFWSAGLARGAEEDDDDGGGGGGRGRGVSAIQAVRGGCVCVCENGLFFQILLILLSLLPFLSLYI